jgi:hypothetical protein
MNHEERVALIVSLSPGERRQLLAFMSGYRPEAFDESVKAWQKGRKHLKQTAGGDQ